MVSSPLLQRLFKDFKQILTTYHILNILLCVSYYFSRILNPVCHVLYGDNAKCVIGQREYEIFLLLAVVIYVKNRKAASFLHYLSNVFMFGKFANAFMFYWSDPKYAIIYGAVVVVVMVLFPEPAYKGPENVTTFRGPYLREEIERDRKNTWMVQFYASWSPLCQQVTPVFADISNNYGLPNLKFAKMDISRYAAEAEKFRINIHPTSRQLPTLSLFQNGKETMRRPTIDSNRRAVPYVFRKENIVNDFGLNTIYNECKESLSNKQKAEMEASPNASSESHTKNE